MLDDLLKSIGAILGVNLIGAYLQGSYAVGDSINATISWYPFSCCVTQKTHYIRLRFRFHSLNFAFDDWGNLRSE